MDREKAHRDREPLDRQLLAGDVYLVWKRRVASARSRVRVFTPYLDRLVVDLLSNATLEPARLAVVTDLSPASGATHYRAQLLAVVRLLRGGVEVRSLPRLHAKMLVVDDASATVGSQNFTSYARRSREATFAPTADLGGAQLLRTLEDWYSEAVPVELGYVERLLALLGDQIAAAQAAHDRLLAEYEEAAQREAARRRRARARLLLEEDRERARLFEVGWGVRSAADQSPYVPWRGPTYARLRTVGESRFYATLHRTRQEMDLTRWSRTRADGHLEAVRLRPQHWYPLLLSPSGRMAVVRLGASRITYLWRGVTWGRPRDVGGQRLWLEVDFPDLGAEVANMRLTVRPFRHASRGYQVDLRFDGTQVLRVEERVVGKTAEVDDLRDAVHDAFGDDAARTALLRDVFDPFKPHHVGIDKHNAASFFGRGTYRVDLADFLTARILLLRPA